MRSKFYAPTSPAFGANREAVWAVDWSGASAGDTMGWDFSKAGAVDVPDLEIGGSPTDADFRTQLPRMRFTVEPLVSSTAGVWSTMPACSFGSAARRGGFALTVRFAMPVLEDYSCAFIGLTKSSSTFVHTGDLDVYDTIGVGFDASTLSTDPLQLVSYDAGSGSHAAVPSATRDPNAVYELTLATAPASDQCLVRLVDLRTGELLIHDVRTSELPSSAEMLYVHAAVSAAATETTPLIEILAMRLEVPDGALHVAPLLGADGIYNVRDFGAVGDGVSDDIGAFEDAVRAMEGNGGTLVLPPGDFFLGRSWRLNLNDTGSLFVRGVAPGQSASLSRITFAPFAGMVVVAPAPPLPSAAPAGPVTLDELRSRTIALEDMTLVGGHLPGSLKRAVDWRVWQSDVDVEAGDPDETPVVLPWPASTYPETSFEYYYECIKSGRTGAVYPDFAGTFRPDFSTEWATGNPYAVNDVVRAPGIYDRLFLCIEPGTSGAGPAWPAIGDVAGDGPELVWRAFDAATHLVADGDGSTLADPGLGAVWSCRVSAGIYSEVRIALRRLWVQGFFNAAVHLQPPDADRIHATAGTGSSIYNAQLWESGAGLALREGASRGCFVAAYAHPIETHDPEAIPEYSRHLGILDQYTKGNRYFAPWLETNGNYLRIVGDENYGSLFGAYFEVGVTQRVDIRAPNFSVWSVGPVGFTESEEAPFWGDAHATEWHAVGARSMSTIDPTNPASTPVELSVRLKADVESVLGFSASDDGEAFTLRNNAPVEGWWGWTRETGSAAMAYGSSALPDGSAQLWFPTGIMLGSVGKRIRVGDDPTAGGGVAGELVFNANPTSTAPAFWQFDGTNWIEGPALP